METRLIYADDLRTYLEGSWGITRSIDDQNYSYKFPKHHCAKVSFTDGRAFHDLDLREHLWRANHQCASDTYDGEFELDGEDVWRSQWIIHGPRKYMTIRTAYTRATLI
jgi:hypothetical protein